MEEDEAIVGKCMDMCPASERALREREGLLHRFERANPEEGIRRAKADVSRTVKAFSRSAAGQSSAVSDSLRPGPVLLNTVSFLLRDIAVTTDYSSLDVYDFVCDRLRAVRQDITIQRLCPRVCVSLLEPMVRFHVFFGYKLASHSKFDSTLNDTQLQECLSRLLLCYDSCETLLSPHKSEIETIYACTNITKPEFVIRRLNFKSNSLPLKLIVAWSVKNYSRVLSLSLKLPLLAKMALAKFIPDIRKYALRSLCYGFSSCNSSFPVGYLAVVLFYNSVNAAEDDCKNVGICCDNGIVKFSKKDYLCGASAHAPIQWWPVDLDLADIDLASLLMEGIQTKHG